MMLGKIKQRMETINTKRVGVVFASSNPAPSEIEWAPNHMVKVHSFSSGEHAFDWCLRNEGAFGLVIVGKETEDITGKKLCAMLKDNVCTDVMLFVETNDDEERVKLFTMADVLLYPDKSPSDEIKRYIKNYADFGKLVPDEDLPVPKLEPAFPLISGTSINEYVLIQELGSGGMSDVWEAKHRNQRERSAIKFLHSRWWNNVRKSQSFCHEAELLSRFSYPHLPRLLSSGYWESYQYSVLPYISAIRGGELISTLSPAPREIAGYVARHLFSTLEYIHSFEIEGQNLGVVHRDICPDNLLFSETGRLYLIDFGSARSILFDEIGTDGNSMNESIAGHHLYLAPEQRDRLAPKYSQQSDIYSAALTVYRLFVHDLYMDRSCSQLAPLPPSGPQFYRDFFATALSTDPSERFRSAADVLEIVQAIFPELSEEEFLSFLQHSIFS
jgi:serine/threonine protein kinase